MLKHFTEDTGHEDRPVVGRVGFSHFLNICDTLASFNIDGSFPVSRNLW